MCLFILYRSGQTCTLALQAQRAYFRSRHPLIVIEYVYAYAYAYLSIYLLIVYQSVYIASVRTNMHSCFTSSARVFPLPTPFSCHKICICISIYLVLVYQSVYIVSVRTSMYCFTSRARVYSPPRHAFIVIEHAYAYGICISIYLSSDCVSVCLYFIGPDKHVLLHKPSARVSPPPTPFYCHRTCICIWHMHIYLSSPCVYVCLYHVGPYKHALLLQTWAHGGKSKSCRE